MALTRRILLGALLLTLISATTAAAQAQTVSPTTADSSGARTVDLNMSPESRRASIERWKAKNRRRNPVQRTAPPAGEPRIVTPAPIIAVQPTLETGAGFQLGSHGGSGRSDLPFSTIAVPYQTAAERTGAPGGQPVNATSQSRRDGH